MARKKRKSRRYKTEPVTGLTYEKGSVLDEFEKSPLWVKLLALGIITAILIWTFVIRPLIDWAKNNLFFIISIIAIVVVIAVIILVFYIKYKKKEEKEKQIFEEIKRSKGLIKFVDRFNNDRWGKPKEVEEWKKEDEDAKEKEKLINRIVNEIKTFKPIRRHKIEFHYQIELIGYLRSKFPNADIEKQKGSSRPDIVVEDVAIEIKGPTRHRDLDSIMSKCARYYQHFGEIVVVLFDIEVNDRYYEEWKKGVKNTFPNVKIIRK